MTFVVGDLPTIRIVEEYPLSIEPAFVVCDGNISCSEEPDATRIIPDTLIIVDLGEVTSVDDYSRCTIEATVIIQIIIVSGPLIPDPHIIVYADIVTDQ